VRAVAPERVTLVGAALDRPLRRGLRTAQLDALLQGRNEILQRDVFIRKLIYLISRS